jgi:hypothetical protein
MEIVFKIGSFGFYGEFNDSLVAREIIKKMPLSATIATWGNEIYWEISPPIVMECNRAEVTWEVAVGDIGFWPEGKCLCVFFGPTPASINERPRPNSPVVILGKTLASVDELKAVKAGEHIYVSLNEKKDKPKDNRILSQAEIDELVKEIMHRKTLNPKP